VPVLASFTLERAVPELSFQIWELAGNWDQILRDSTR